MGGDGGRAEFLDQFIEADTPRRRQLLQASGRIVGKANGHRAHGNFSRHSEGVITKKLGYRIAPERRSIQVPAKIHALMEDTHNVYPAIVGAVE